MRKIFQKFLADEHGQDLIEYALMAGFVAVAAGAVMPHVVESVAVVWAKLNALLAGQTAANIVVSADFTWLRILCAGLAVLVVVLIVLRRRRQRKSDEDW